MPGQACAAPGEVVRQRVAFVLIDGIGDVHIPELGGLTPLQAADTPTLDAIAAAGLNGLVDPVEPGLACGSDTAHLSLFGYDPRLYYRGRGAFESMGAGIPMQPGDIAFKSNFATVDEASGVVVSRRADRRFEAEGPALCAALDGLRLPSFPQHSVRCRYATEHRCGVVVSGPRLCDRISGTDPLRDGLPLQEAQPLDDSAEARHTAAVVAELSAAMRAVLREHGVNAERRRQGKAPANVVLLRGCGSRIAVQPFAERHGLRGCCCAPTKIIAGDYKTQFHAKAAAIADALITKGFDFGFLHVKAVDDTGHDRAAAMKVRYFEAVDAMTQQLVARLAAAESASSSKGSAGGEYDSSCRPASSSSSSKPGSSGNGPGSGSSKPDGSGSCRPDGSGSGSGSKGSRFAVLVTGDHSTPVVFGDHSHEPVPLAVAHVRHIAAACGGAAALAAVPLGRIPHPAPPESQPSLQQLGQQARERHRAAGVLQRPTTGDAVCRFDEGAASAGCLGRFPGSQVMALVRQIAASD